MNSENRLSFKEEKDIKSNNRCANACCNKKNNDVFVRLSRPNSKFKVCSKTVSTIGVQTDLQTKQTGKKPNKNI